MVAGSGLRRGLDSKRAHKGVSWGDGNVLRADAGGRYTYLHIFKVYRTGRQKSNAYFIVCKSKISQNT